MRDMADEASAESSTVDAGQAVPSGTPQPRVRLREKDDYQAPLAQWPLPRQPPFVGSRELRWLKADLTRYVRGQVRGRSYLIAGHRGAGKTSLTVRAVEQLASEVLRQSVTESAADLPDGPLQRPLLVKLHGPSMLEEQTPPGAAAAQPAADAPEAGDPNGAASEETAPAHAPASVAAGVHAALVQITIGLYRALASEASTGFRAHALHGAESRPGDQMELAAQLSLELDSGATPALLRKYWSALGRLRMGVFWPATADKTCLQHGMADQGLREITAISTAAQAFQVCTGRVSYTSKINDSVVRTLTSELKGASDFKQAVTRLGTLGIGALTGVSLLSAGPVTAVIGGLAVWLLGSLSLSWSRKSTRNDTRSVDYSFIRDFTLATLERDLPIVVTRVKEAGLVPVFVIDELDKVSDAPKALSDLVGRLKHLIADFGFFCFLVNRDCYEAIEASVRSRAYPSEHTLFSERLLLRPDPEFALKFLLELVEGDPAGPETDLARVTFALTLMHGARLNLTDMMRLLRRVSPTGDGEVGTARELSEQRRLVLATVQIAIDETLRSPALASRMETDAGFAQLAIDTVYEPSRLWAEGNLEIDPSPEALRERLQRRMRGGSVAGEAEGEETDRRHPPISAANLELLQSHLVRLLKLLCDLEGLRTKLGERNPDGASAAPGGTKVLLADIPPLDVAGICEPMENGRFRFLFNSDGSPAGTEPGRLNPTQRDRARFLIDYAAAFEILLASIGVSIDDLAQTPLLTSVFSDTVSEAKRVLVAALVRGEFDAQVEQRLSVLERLHGEIGRSSAKLGELLIIAGSLRRDVDDPSPILPAISPLIRFDLPPDRWLTGRSGRPAHSIPSDVAGIVRWQGEFDRWLLPAPGQMVAPGLADYERLAEPMIRHFANPGRVGSLEVDYRLLAHAALNQLPAAALRARLDFMTSGNWSALALAAVPRPRRPATAPYWMLVAGLRGLGFGKAALAELADEELASDLKATGWIVETPEMTPAQCFDIVRRLVANAPDRPKGILVMESEEARYAHQRPIERRPALIIDRGELQDYLPALRWLEALDVFAGQTLGRTADDEAE